MRFGCGILPVSFYKGEFYVLFGRERRIPKAKDSCMWSDFGGASEENESRIETACREGYEELNGCLGDVHELKKRISDDLLIKIDINNSTYTTFLIRVDYDIKIEDSFKDIYDYVLNNNQKLLYEHNGLYEKDLAKWVKVKDLMKFKKKIRKFYRPMIKKIVKFFNHSNI